MYSIFEKILYMIFALPALLIKEAFEMVVKNKTHQQKKKILWNMALYGLLAILVILAVILWMKGYR